MKTHTLFSLLSILSLALALTACSQSTQGPQVWLDHPLDDSTVPLEPLIIQAHASDADGVARIEFYVDHALLNAVDAGGVRLGRAAVEWLPTASGTYAIRARAVDNSGNYGPDAFSYVVVDGEPVEPVPTQTPAATSTPTPTSKPGIPPDPPTPTSTPHSEMPIPTATPQPPAPLPTDTPLPPAQVSFTADLTHLTVGECTTLRWEVENATAVFLNGEGVVGHDGRQVCPSETTLYTLRVQAPAGDLERHITIDVTALPTWTSTPDTTPPTISSAKAFPDKILTEGGGCSTDPRTTTVTVAAHDNESGIDTVRADWSLDGEGGQVTLSLNGGLYEGEIGPVHTTGKMVIAVYVQDRAGNDAYTDLLYVTVQACIK